MWHEHVLRSTSAEVKTKDCSTTHMTVFKKIVKNDGISGLYRGFAISWLLTGLYRSSYFGLFYTGKEYLFDKELNSYMHMWLFATSTTCFSNFLFYPLDTIRRRMMMSTGILVSLWMLWNCVEIIKFSTNRHTL